MDDATYERIAAQINALVAYWKPRLRLLDWRIAVKVVRGTIVSEADKRATNDADSDPRWEYEEGTLRFAAPDLAERDADYLEWLVVHELMHARLHELHRDGEGPEIAAHQKHEEHTASVLADVVITLDRAARSAASA